MPKRCRAPRDEPSCPGEEMDQNATSAITRGAEVSRVKGRLANVPRREGHAMRPLLPAIVLLLVTHAARAAEFANPVRLEADGAAIRVEAPGYAAPCWADVDGDGKK